jgi:hypothetical protein
MDTIPWFVLLGILGVKAFLNDQGLTVLETSTVISVALMLITISVAMNAVGAMSKSAASWNDQPSIDLNPQRLWDYRHPQFLAWAEGLSPTNPSPAP